MFYTKSQYVKALSKGHMEDCYKQARSYGNIVEDHSFDIEMGSLAGSHRIIKIEHYKINVEFELHNGEVVGMNV